MGSADSKCMPAAPAVACRALKLDRKRIWKIEVRVLIDEQAQAQIDFKDFGRLVMLGNVVVETGMDQASCHRLDTVCGGVTEEEARFALMLTLACAFRGEVRLIDAFGGEIRIESVVKQAG